MQLGRIKAESTQTHMFLLCACAQKKHVVIDSKQVNYRDRNSEFLSRLLQLSILSPSTTKYRYMYMYYAQCTSTCTCIYNYIEFSFHRIQLFLKT